MRLMLVCAMAATLPTIIDSSASTISISCHSTASGSKPPTSKRMPNANAASFGTAADQQRHCRRRTLVHVRHPHVERHRAQLERHADTTKTRPNSSMVGWMTVHHRVGRCRSGRASRSRRTASTCRRAGSRKPARRARSTSSPLRSARSRIARSAIIAYSDSDISSRPRYSVRKLLAAIITSMAEQREHAQHEDLATEQAAIGEIAARIEQRQRRRCRRRS